MGLGKVSAFNSIVIPAQAGIQPQANEVGRDAGGMFVVDWAPAFAGVTIKRSGGDDKSGVREGASKERQPGSRV